MLLRSGEMTFIYGPAGSGKGFVALDAALRLASGKPAWLGQPIPPRSRVIYCSTEPDAVTRRTMAWMDDRGLRGAVMDNFSVVGIKPGRAILCQNMRDNIYDKLGHLVVFDTLAGMVQNENAADEVMEALGFACLLREAGLHVMLIQTASQPARVDDSGRVRGRVVIDSLADTVLRVDLRQVLFEKSRDSENTRPVPFSIGPVAGNGEAAVIRYAGET